MTNLSNLISEDPQPTLTKDNVEHFLGKFKIQEAAEQEPHMNMIVYGESGIGKTRLAGSCSLVDALKPVLFVDVEGGTFSLRDVYPDVHVVRVQNWIEMQDVYNELFDGNHPYKTVVLDSLSEMQKFSMYHIMQELIKSPEGRERDPDIPSVREWGKNIEQMRRMVRAFRDLPMSTIFTALVRGDRNAKTGITTHQPSLSGKLAGEVAAFVDFVFYMYVKPDEEGALHRYLLTAQTDTHIAKDRSGRMPTVIGLEDEDVLMSTVYDYIFKKQSK